MCGIAGWIAPPSTERNASALSAMLTAIAHRGPDGEGSFHATAADGRDIALGHRRLAIIDLAGGVQPMRDDDAGLALVFNGEIYNFRELRSELAAFGHRFALDSDTEVLLRAYCQWGTETPNHLRGMFAFALWDASRQRLLLARDRFGEKPLFLCEKNGSLFFASEIKALLRLPECRGSVDSAAVWDYLAYRYVPAPRTLVSGIRKLMPGCALLVEGRKMCEWRYWSPPDRLGFGIAQQTTGTVGTNTATTTDDTIVEDFLAQLDNAVAAQMVSDVPFGAFLSGGLDSSMIVALMTRHCSSVRTFSVGFSGDAGSELPYAAEISRRFSTTHEEILVEPGDVVKLLPELIGFRDAPVSEPSDVAIHRMALHAARSVKMVLTGEGSDEILGGYPKHVFERFVPDYQRLPGALRRGLLAPLARALPYGFRRAKTAVANLNIENPQERYVRWFGAIDHRQRKALARAENEAMLDASTNTIKVNGPPFDAESNNSALRRILYFDQTSWLPDNLLERGDRMTMAASIEARVPFLDHRLAEYVSALPDDCRVRGIKTKWILRQAGRRVLPENILKRKKVGFRVPIERWFRGELREYLGDHLLSPNACTREYYQRPELERIVGEHLSGRQNHEKLLWSLLNLEIWHRRHAVSA